MHKFGTIHGHLVFRVKAVHALAKDARAFARALPALALAPDAVPGIRVIAALPGAWGARGLVLGIRQAFPCMGTPVRLSGPTPDKGP